MFGLVKKKLDVSVKDIDTIIGFDVVIKGDISGSSNIRIDGTIEGSVAVSGSVIIGDRGSIKGNVSATDMSVSGSVEGDVTIENHLSISSTGKLVGDIRAGSLKIEEGGTFKGRSEMTPHSSLTPAFED